MDPYLCRVVVARVAAGHLQAGAPDPLPSGDDAVTHALNRLTFGPRPGEVARVKTA